jgi:nitroreductase/SAM-dependent methyltransferase
MNLERAIRNRRSIRKFKDRKIDRKAREKIIEAGRYAPSACNLQMWHFIVVDKKDVKEKLYSIANSPSAIKNSDFTVFVLYDKKTTPKNYANVQSASAAIQNMLLQAYSLGIGSVWLNEYGDPNKVKEILGIPDNFIQISAVAFGYPDETPKCPARREGVVSYNSFGKMTDQAYPNSLNPDDWTMEEIKSYHSFKIRAKSPSSEIHQSDSKGFKLVVDEIDPIKGKVLDVFPYYANYTHAIVKAGKIKDLSVLEMSDEVLNFIKWKIGNSVKTIKGLAEFPIMDESFDCVTCLGALDLTPSTKKIISEIHRVLKENGIFYLLFSNEISPFGLYFHYRMFRGLPLDVPFRPLNYGKVMKSLNKFKIEKIVGINLVPRTELENFKTTGLLKRFCKIILVKAKKC